VLRKPEVEQAFMPVTDHFRTVILSKQSSRLCRNDCASKNPEDIENLQSVWVLFHENAIGFRQRLRTKRHTLAARSE
jgi:hypothetical protein